MSVSSGLPRGANRRGLRAGAAGSSLDEDGRRCQIHEVREPKRRAPRLEWWQGLLGLLVGGMGAQVAGVVALVAAAALWLVASGRLDPASIQAVQNELLSNFAILGPTVAVTGLTMAAVAFVTVLLARVEVREGLGFKGAPWPAFVAAPIGILALGPTSDGLRQLMQTYLPNFTVGALEGLDQLARSGPIWAIVPLMALVPGFSEELMFRGMFQRSIRRPMLALVLSGVLFAAYHMDPHHVVAVLPLGLYLAWLGYRTDSVLVPMVAHVANNAAAVIGSRYFVEPGVEQEPTEWWWIPAGWLIAAAAIAVTWWSTRRRAAALVPAETAVEPVPAPVPLDPGE